MEEYRKEISNALLSGCRQGLAQAKKDFTRKKIFGFVLVPNSGFVDFSLAIGLRGVDENPDSGRLSDEEFAELDPDEQELLLDLRATTGPDSDENESVAANWENFGSYGSCFDDLYDLLTPLFDEFYEGYTPEEIGNFFESVCLDVISKLINDKKALKAKCFERDLLTGIQFADPDRADRVIRVSKELNSKTWHNRIVNYFSQYDDSKKKSKRPVKKAKKSY